MGGQVVSAPEQRHKCAPGWRDHYVDRQDSLGFGPGWYSAPPDASEFPRGTVWQCECGKTWVSLGREGPGSMFCRWRRERRWERRRREARTVLL